MVFRHENREEETPEGHKQVWTAREELAVVQCYLYLGG